MKYLVPFSQSDSENLAYGIISQPWSLIRNLQRDKCYPSSMASCISINLDANRPNRIF